MIRQYKHVVLLPSINKIVYRLFRKVHPVSTGAD